MVREGDVDIDRLTVLGVDPDDARLSAELWRFVPDDADAVYRPRFADPPAGAILRAALVNPPVTVVVFALLAVRRVRRGPDPPVSTATEEIAADLGLASTVLDVDPLDGVHDQGLWWSLGAWVTTAVVVGVAAAVAIDLGPVTLLLAIVALPLAASYVFAHGGAHIQRRDTAIFGATVERAVQGRHQRPVVVVRERHVPGVADRGKDALVDTDAWTVSSHLTADESLY